MGIGYIWKGNIRVKETIQGENYIETWLHIEKIIQKEIKLNKERQYEGKNYMEEDYMKKRDWIERYNIRGRTIQRRDYIEKGTEKR